MASINFGTDGWRAKTDEFTVPRVRMVGQAVATYLDADEQPAAPVAVGYDARERSRSVAEELSRVLAGAGHDVLIANRDCPTPVVAHAVADRELAGALMVTASHNPPEYNGVKFIPAGGAPALPAVTDAIEANLAAPAPRPESEWGSVREIDFIEPHAEAMLELIDPALNGLAIAYDAMHGSGRGVTDAVLERAGAAVTRVRCERDPTFGGDRPEPAPGHLDELVETVTEGRADIGIANDGDADRIAVVTPDRGVLDANYLFAVLYDHLLATGGGPAIRTVSTSFLIDRVAGAHEEAVVETPVGFKWVAEAMGRKDALIGGEESGGFAIRGGVRNKDGVVIALLVAAADVEESLDSRVDRLLATHGEIHQDRRSLDCPDHEKERILHALEGDIPTTIAGVPVEDVITKDGFKLLLADGSWLLIRPSGTEPKLRVYAEAASETRVRTLLEAGREIVEPLL